MIEVLSLFSANLSGASQRFMFEQSFSSFLEIPSGFDSVYKKSQASTETPREQFSTDLDE